MIVGNQCITHAVALQEIFAKKLLISVEMKSTNFSTCPKSLPSRVDRKPYSHLDK
jgi:hypothetical protein